uniref:Claudin 34 n=1 Tax=Amphiprion percula TaxID=161767 RepID=A0A3P8S4E2_AMPPE
MPLKEEGNSLCALWLACVGWTLTAVALGLVQWRVWLVSHSEAISSGVAWVGVWRTCFNSRTVASPGFTVMHCSRIGLTEEFTPPEIAAAQVLMMLSLLVGLCGNAGGVYAMRNACFGLDENPPIRLCFVATGALCLLAAGMSSVPVIWNLSSVATNRTIRFPPEFKMPAAPDSQHVGCGVVVGMVGTVLMVMSGVIFCTYRSPVSRLLHRSPQGTDNPAFVLHEHL